jgi:hypothetical protein
MEKSMTAFNVVRFKVKPGNEERFIEAHRSMNPLLEGFIGGNLIKTGDQTFCVVGEWRSFDSIVNARPQMIALLDGMREMLEDLGEGLGVTDPVSGDVVVRLGPPKKATKKRLATRSRRGAASKGKSKAKAKTRGKTKGGKTKGKSVKRRR